VQRYLIHDSRAANDWQPQRVRIDAVVEQHVLDVDHSWWPSGCCPYSVPLTEPLPLARFPKRWMVSYIARMFSVGEAVKKLGQAPLRLPIFKGFRRVSSEPVPFFHSLGVTGQQYASISATVLLWASRLIIGRNSIRLLSGQQRHRQTVGLARVALRAHRTSPVLVHRRAASVPARPSTANGSGAPVGCRPGAAFDGP
jgi:hypothetical protein